jgi:hydrogenase maturation protein HypF
MTTRSSLGSVATWTRVRILVSGAVQGIGFRPFVYRLAQELKLSGSVANSPRGVLIDAQGEQAVVQQFMNRLQTERPSLALIRNTESVFLPASNDRSGFQIQESETKGAPDAFILPDLATCPDCVRELFDPRNRRYLYPFTNCTHCGPRFSIIEKLPYDRANTSMKRFVMCDQCEREYHEPNERRFHAQPNACPNCGPRLQLWEPGGATKAEGPQALLECAAALRRGLIIAVKGVGGFQLIADARNEGTVRELRKRKRREDKPFAVMFPVLATVKHCCRVEPLEEELLVSTAAPITLVPKLNATGRSAFSIAHSVAPENPWLGVILPYSPLPHLLLRRLGFPIIATSGNLSDEPICIDEHEALMRLRGIADLFLVHNRPIVRHVDDSVARVIAGREMLLRRARGYAPLPIDIGTACCGAQPTVISVGAQQKNTVALAFNNQAFLSQHIGDLETPESLSAFQKTVADLPCLYDAKPRIIAHDLHPDYASTAFVESGSGNGSETSVQAIAVQHHYAHVLSCMAENELSGPALGVGWDGTGLGADGTLWGSEFLRITEHGFERVAHLRPFRLPGGDAAAKEPCRSALGLLYEVFGTETFSRKDLLPLEQFSVAELRTFERMIGGGINAPLTSSAGRFFDAIASLLGLRQRCTFEGQAAMELEFAAATGDRETPNSNPQTPGNLQDSNSNSANPGTSKLRQVLECGTPVPRSGMSPCYTFEPSNGAPMVIDWRPTIREILADLNSRIPVPFIAEKFHNTLAEMIVSIANRVGERNVVLSGGCFQNRLLTERAIHRLVEEGFVPFWHRRVPPNDGGIALGQVVAAARAARSESVWGQNPMDRASAGLVTCTNNGEKAMKVQRANTRKSVCA